VLKKLEKQLGKLLPYLFFSDTDCCEQWAKELEFLDIIETDQANVVGNSHSALIEN